MVSLGDIYPAVGCIVPLDKLSADLAMPIKRLAAVVSHRSGQSS